MTFVYTFSSGLLIAIVSSLLAVRLALWRFHSEKWWERKAELYTRLLEGLYEILDYHDKWLESYHQNDEESGQTPEQVERKKAKDDALLERFQSAKADLDKITVIGAFIVSPAVAEDLSTYRKLQREAWVEIRTGDTYPGVESMSFATEQCLRAVREHAKEDLGLKRRLPPLLMDFFNSDAAKAAMETMLRIAGSRP